MIDEYTQILAAWSDTPPDETHSRLEVQSKAKGKHKFLPLYSIMARENQCSSTLKDIWGWDGGIKKVIWACCATHLFEGSSAIVSSGGGWVSPKPGMPGFATYLDPQLWRAGSPSSAAQDPYAFRLEVHRLMAESSVRFLVYCLEWKTVISSSCCYQQLQNWH